MDIQEAIKLKESSVIKDALENGMIALSVFSLLNNGDMIVYEVDLNTHFANIYRYNYNYHLDIYLHQSIN